MPIIHDPPTQPATEELLQKNAVTINNLSFAYPDGHRALHNISLRVREGEKIALVGPNGAGKSTLMLQLNGILKGEGELEIGLLPLNKENLPLIRSLVGLVFQNPDDQLFSPTVFEDVAFGPLHMGLPEEEVIARVETALAQVDMRGFEDRLSHHPTKDPRPR